ncbi:inositol monophosphatase family protein [Oceanibium sediminis]|uniref:inositol monophosphatase family protein n=1 Tax=Oceanibium sediminis TaxID=2026339 RepID=UPI000DD3A2A8|nr:inositol monophosphatase family protein [Oceanibium sediminis]
MDIAARASSATEIARSAGQVAMDHFRDPASLHVESKGQQDWVSEADTTVELAVRQALAQRWPDDAIVGEEHASVAGRSGFTWVIDPIDGTTNFVNAIPAWTVVLAGVLDGKTVIGVIHDPIHGETFTATRGGGAALNGQPIRVADLPLQSGSVGVGYSNRVEAENVLPVLDAVVRSGAMFHRNASGALSIAYVAAGRLLGYLEEHMNAWDCLAGQLLVEEAGGGVEVQDADRMIQRGGRVVVGAGSVFDELKRIADAAWPGVD